MAKEPTFAGHGSFDESRQARLRRIRDEVRAGRYQVNEERLCLCILARSTEVVAAHLAGRGFDVRRPSC